MSEEDETAEAKEPIPVASPSEIKESGGPEKEKDTAEKPEEKKPEEKKSGGKKPSEEDSMVKMLLALFVNGAKIGKQLWAETLKPFLKKKLSAIFSKITGNKDASKDGPTNKAIAGSSAADASATSPGAHTPSGDVAARVDVAEKISAAADAEMKAVEAEADAKIAASAAKGAAGLFAALDPASPDLFNDPSPSTPFKSLDKAVDAAQAKGAAALNLRADATVKRSAANDAWQGLNAGEGGSASPKGQATPALEPADNTNAPSNAPDKARGAGDGPRVAVPLGKGPDTAVLGATDDIAKKIEESVEIKQAIATPMDAAPPPPSRPVI